MISYDAGNLNWLSTHKQRPMFVSAFGKHDHELYGRNLDYNKTVVDFKNIMHDWITSHKHIQYHGLENYPVKDIILGTTHALDDLHFLYGDRLCVYVNEYRYHKRITDGKIKTIRDNSELQKGDAVVISYPSAITTNYHWDFKSLLKRAESLDVPIHIDGAWFGCCRNFELDLTHPQIKSVFVSLSKAFGMGAHRIGIRYTRERQRGSVTSMNEQGYVNIADAWLGIQRIERFGPDYLWNTYKKEYDQVIKDWNLTESDAFHIAFKDPGRLIKLGIRTPLRYLIDKKFDARGTDAGLNAYELAEKKAGL